MVDLAIVKGASCGRMSSLKVDCKQTIDELGTGEPHVRAQVSMLFLRGPRLCNAPSSGRSPRSAVRGDDLDSRGRERRVDGRAGTFELARLRFRLGIVGEDPQRFTS